MALVTGISFHECLPHPPRPPQWVVSLADVTDLSDCGCSSMSYATLLETVYIVLHLSSAGQFEFKGRGARQLDKFEFEPSVTFSTTG